VLAGVAIAGVEGRRGEGSAPVEVHALTRVAGVRFAARRIERNRTARVVVTLLEVSHASELAGVGLARRARQRSALDRAA
jgi:hypothetical protein